MAATKPNVPLIKINRTGETSYEVVLRKDITAAALQVVIEGSNVSDLVFSDTIPPVWIDRRQVRLDGSPKYRDVEGCVIFLNFEGSGTELLPAGILATFTADKVPRIYWDEEEKYMPTEAIIMVDHEIVAVDLEDPDPSVPGFEGSATYVDPDENSSDDVTSEDITSGDISSGDIQSDDHVSQPSKEHDNDSGGGCNSFPSVALLAVLLLPVTKRSK